MQDIWITENMELATFGGDFYVDESTEQHKFLLLALQPGEFKESPMVGIGLVDIILDNELLKWRHKIAKQVTDDGMQINKLVLTQTSFELDANYTN